MAPDSDPHPSGPSIRRAFEHGYMDLPLPTEPDAWFVNGGRLMPRVIDVHLDPLGARPEWDLHIEWDDYEQAHRISNIRMQAPRDSSATPRGQRRLDFEAVRESELVPLFVAMAGYRIVEPGDSREGAEAEASFVRRGLERLFDRRTAIRRTIDATLLEEVAANHRGEPGGIARVERAFGVSKNTAIRWVKRARRDGYLPDKGEG